MKKLIILGKGPVGGKPMTSIKTKEDIPGYVNHDVWTVATHPIEDADGYLAMHGEKVKRMIKFPEDAQGYADCKLLVNNSISVMLLKAVIDCGYEYVRIAGCPLTVGSEYTEQRESLFQIMGYLRTNSYVTELTWDDDIADYNNYYSNVLGIKY